MPHMTHDLLTAAEAAELLRVSISSVYRWVRDGEIEGLKVGGTVRIRRSDVDALLTPKGAA